MAQVILYGLATSLAGRKQAVSDILHSCIVETLHIPPEKRFHRFICLDAEDFFYPADRSVNYLIIEISIFEGRSIESKKALIRLIFERFASDLGIAPQDIEITIFETPRHHWGIRGKTGDELSLNYRVEI